MEEVEYGVRQLVVSWAHGSTYASDAVYYAGYQMENEPAPFNFIVLISDGDIYDAAEAKMWVNTYKSRMRLGAFGVFIGSQYGSGGLGDIVGQDNVVVSSVKELTDALMKLDLCN